MRIAIIGSGISGSLAARILASQFSITLYESAGYVGGHANTVDVELGGQSYPVDTGFMVYNERTYPNFCRLLRQLGVPSRASDMSFSVQCRRSGIEYQGSSLNGVFAQRTNLLRPSFYRLLRQILRFNRLGTAAVRDESLRDVETVGDFLQANGLGDPFVSQYLVPMTAAIWSATPSEVLRFPARFLLGFFANHGLMQLRDRPVWRTISGGSREYLAKLLRPIQSSIRLNTPVVGVSRDGHRCTVRTADGDVSFYDHVVFATHSDITLRLLDDPTPAEQYVLSAFPYQRNYAVLHTDTSWLPWRRRAWASWNYIVEEDGQNHASVTYDLSRLQGHDSPTPILLTLNPARSIRDEFIMRDFTYHHPAFSIKAARAQEQWSTISGHNRTSFCGAYWKYGFHEDGVNSAIAVARQFNLDWEPCIAASIKEPSGIAATNP